MATLNGEVTKYNSFNPICIVNCSRCSNDWVSNPLTGIKLLAAWTSSDGDGYDEKCCEGSDPVGTVGGIRTGSGIRDGGDEGGILVRLPSTKAAASILCNIAKVNC